MKHALLYLLLLPLLVCAQEKKKNLLVVPVFKNNISFEGVSERCLRYNNVSRDSAARYVYETCRQQVAAVFNGYNVYYTGEYETDSLPNSGYELRLRNRFYYNDSDLSYHLLGNKLLRESYRNNYYACELNAEGREMIKEASENLECDYILFINRFETARPNTTLSLACEVRDKNLKKIYGSKNEYMANVSKTMYFDVMAYYIREAERQMLKEVHEFLRGVKP